MFVILTSVDVTFSIRSRYTDIFLNQLIQFYSNNATNLHHLTTHSTTCWPTKWRSHCDHRYMTSLHPMYTYGDSDVITSYHIYASCFPAITWGQALRNVCHCDTTFLVRYGSDNTYNFLNQLIQFYSNNATRLHNLTSINVAPQHGDRNVTADYCDVTSPYVLYISL